MQTEKNDGDQKAVDGKDGGSQTTPATQEVKLICLPLQALKGDL